MLAGWKHVPRAAARVFKPLVESLQGVTELIFWLLSPLLVLLAPLLAVLFRWGDRQMERKKAEVRAQMEAGYGSLHRKATTKPIDQQDR